MIRCYRKDISTTVVISCFHLFDLLKKTDDSNRSILYRFDWFQSYRVYGLYGLLGGEGFVEKKREPSFPAFGRPADAEAAVDPPAV